MGRYKERYHQAAKDGHLNVIKEATRQDCNAHDEDGMTPVLWAAFYGNLEALRLLITRGGSPDKADHTGNTALHCAAVNGHLPCASFLVNFGVNIWSLDNGFHTALDLAGIRDHRTIVEYLDDVSAKQTLLNHRLVKRMRNKAVVAANKRIEAYERLQEKTARRVQKDDRYRGSNSNGGTVPADTTYFGGPASTTSRSTYPPSSPGAASARHTAKSTAKTNYSNYFTVSEKPRFGLFKHRGVARKAAQRKADNASIDFKVVEKAVDGRKTVRSISGLKRDSEVLYTSKSADNDALDGQFDARSRAHSEPDFTYNDSGVDTYGSRDAAELGIFERSGFGNVAFLSRPQITDSLFSMHSAQRDASADRADTAHAKPKRLVDADSIGTVDTLLRRMETLPWGEASIDLLEDDDDMTDSPLHLFLACYNASDYAFMFTREHIDLDALMLCTEADLKQLGLPLGPRRKLLYAIEHRKQQLSAPSCIKDRSF